MSDATGKPGSLAFIRIPAHIAADLGSFRVNPDIPVPVELGSDGGDPSSLSWEMMVAGMLRFLADQGGHEHADYYRAFVNAVKPDLPTELSAAGIMKAKNGEYELADEIFRALAGLLPEAPEPLLNLAVLKEDRADALERSGREAEAEQMREAAFDLYKRLLSMEQPGPDAYFNAGFFFLKARSYDRALELFEQYLDMGQEKAKLGKAKEIVDRLRTRSRADEDFKSAYDLIRMGRETDGIRKAIDFCEANPSLPNGWFLVGWGHRRLGQYSDALAAFQKALELGQKEVDLYNELSICEMELGMLKDSRMHLEAALRLEPENLKIMSNLGVLSRRMGRDGEAAGFFRAVLDLEPGDELALAQLKELEA